MCILCFETLSVESDDDYDSGVFVSGIECIDMSEECNCVEKCYVSSAAVNLCENVGTLKQDCYTALAAGRNGSVTNSYLTCTSA